MSPDQIPPDTLFIRWGKFQAGASGRVAMLAAVTLILTMLAWIVTHF
jgi:hypothetical protein